MSSFLRPGSQTTATREIPSVDREVPQKLETATFANG